MSQRAYGLVAVLLGWLCVGMVASSQPVVQVEKGDGGGNGGREGVSPAVKALISAEYLTEEERKDLRVFYGLATDEDLDTPRRRATDALIRGDYFNRVFDETEVMPESRARALIERGEPELGLKVLAGVSSLEGIRWRARALEMLGRFDEANAALEPLVNQLINRKLTDSGELASAVQGLIIRTRVRQQEMTGGADFRTLLSLLTKARSELNQLDWRVALAEAELLYSKDNRKQARDAAMDVLRLNPRCAKAMVLIGQIAVDGFDFDSASVIVRQLDELAEGSAEGAMILARGRLRQKDAVDARGIIDLALERQPQHRGLLALQAAAVAAGHNYEEADALLGRFDELSPGSALGYLQVGLTLSEARQYERAEEYLREAIQRQPLVSEPRVELGLMLLQAGRSDEALTMLTSANELDPFNVRVDNSLKLARELASYATASSEHFVIRYQPGVQGVLAEEMPEILERIYDRVTGLEGIDHEPERVTQIELMPDHAWFSVRITGMPAIHTMAASTGPVIAMEFPRAGPGQLVGEYDWARVVQHEYTHTVTLSRTKNRIPHWYTEAAAVVMEDAPRDYVSCQALAKAAGEGTLFDLEEINIAFVRPRLPGDRSKAYAQGSWMYEFITSRWGSRANLDLMDLYAQGVDEASAMQRVLGLESEAFLQAFTSWAKGQIREWGLGTPEGEKPVSELMLEMFELTQEDWDELSASERPVPSVEQLAELLANHPEHPGVLSWAVRWTLQEQSGVPDESMIELLKRYAKARPVDPLPHQMLLRIYLDQERAGQPIADAGTIIEHLLFLDAREQHSAAYAVELARRYAAMGEYHKAMDKAKRATHIAPLDADYRELAARIAIRMGDFAQAQRQLAALARIEPDREVHKRRLDAINRMIDGQ